MEMLHNVGLAQCLENPDVVKKWGDMSDWHHAVGTGPFILKEFAAGKSCLLDKNPDYWGNDERHPQNKLPMLITMQISNHSRRNADAVEAMRAGKVDVMNGVSYQRTRWRIAENKPGNNTNTACRGPQAHYIAAARITNRRITKSGCARRCSSPLTCRPSPRTHYKGIGGTVSFDDLTAART